MNQKNWHWLKFVLNFLVKTAIFVSVLLVGLGYVSIYDLLHLPRSIPPGDTLVEENVQFRAVDLITDDGIRLSAWYTPPRNGAIILLAHGYGDNRPEWIYAILAKKGYGVLAWDARAHGESDGEISTLGYLEVLDVKAALEYALTQPDVKHIGAWGGSMGGATLIRATAQFPKIEALVVDSAYTSLSDEIDFIVPYSIINPLAKFLAEIGAGIKLDEASPLDEIAKISPRPVYIIQGGSDEVASPDSAGKLYNAAGEPRYLWFEEDAIHLGIHQHNPPRYQRRVVRFFDEWLLN